MVLLIQVTFQVVLTTDSQASFAVFVYENASALSDLDENIEIGFYASDGIREATFFIDNLLNVNVYRIDGE